MEGVAARAVFEANQSGISEKIFRSLKKQGRGHTSLPEHKNIAHQLKNMITLKSFDLKIVKISTKQTYSVLENIDFQDTSRSEAYARSEPIYTLLDLNRCTRM